MSEFFDYDASTGMVYSTDYDQTTDKSIVHSYQDVQPVLDHIKHIRDSGTNDKGIKRDFWLYATIPVGVQVELLGKGLNIHDKNCTKDLMREINQNYPHLKNTYLHHE